MRHNNDEPIHKYNRTDKYNLEIDNALFKWKPNNHIPVNITRNYTKSVLADLKRICTHSTNELHNYVHAATILKRMRKHALDDPHIFAHNEFITIFESYKIHIDLEKYTKNAYKRMIAQIETSMVKFIIAEYKLNDADINSRLPSNAGNFVYVCLKNSSTFF